MGRMLEKLFRLSQVFRSYPLCHSRPDRSFCYHERYFGLCARCTTMYMSGFIMILSLPLWRGLSPEFAMAIGIFSLVPGGVDGITQMFGNRESTNRLRAVTGGLLGVGVVVFVYGICAFIF